MELIMWLVAVATFFFSWWAVSRLAPGGRARRHLMGFCGGVAGLVILALIFGEAPADPDDDEPVQTAADLMVMEYAIDTTKANGKYRGKFVDVTGIVQRVARAEANVEVLLEGPKETVYVKAVMTGPDATKALLLNPGVGAALRCVGFGSEAGLPLLMSCTFHD